MVRKYVLSAITVTLVMPGCVEEPISIGDPPAAPEFSVEKIDENNIAFSVKSAEGFMVNWDFGNGMLSQKETDTMYYPFADTYTVSLTTSNKGGATTTKEELIIGETDPAICANKYYTFISGGCDVESKTWVIDNADSALANGNPAPKDSNGAGQSNYNDRIAYWWKSSLATDPPVPPDGALDDEYVFGLKGFTYKNECHGDFYFNWKWCNKLFGTTQATYADTVHAYIPNNPATWKLEVDIVTREDTIADGSMERLRFFTDSTTGTRFNLILKLSNNNYMGYCSGVSDYQILSINADTMYLRHELAEPEDQNATGPNRLEWRYLRLVAKE